MTLQSVHIAAVLRNTGDGWTILNNAGHLPEHVTGVDPVAAEDVCLKVNFDQTFARVGAIAVSADETFAGLYVAGASVGLAYFNLFIKDAAGLPVLPAALVSPHGNWWITGTMWHNV